MLDPVWLNSFATVAQSLSFTEAAARLGIRQSTVSEHIRKLEAACGKRLFSRDTHSVVVTPDGEAMLGFAKSILETNERVMRHFSRDDVRGHVRLVVLAPPALTRSIALAALEKGGCPWRIICSSDSQSGVHAAVFAGLGIAPHARSLLPADLIVFQSKGLPRLGATEFVMLTRKGARSSSLEALSSTLMNSPLSRRS